MFSEKLFDVTERHTYERNGRERRKCNEKTNHKRHICRRYSSCYERASNVSFWLQARICVALQMILQKEETESEASDTNCSSKAIMPCTDAEEEEEDGNGDGDGDVDWEREFAEEKEEEGEQEVYGEETQGLRYTVARKRCAIAEDRRRRRRRSRGKQQTDFLSSFSNFLTLVFTLCPDNSRQLVSVLTLSLRS